MSDSHINEVPEFKHHSTEARRREVAAAGASPQQHLDKIRQRLKAPNLTSIETQIEPLASVPGCIERFQVTGLQVGPNQRMKSSWRRRTTARKSSFKQKRPTKIRSTNSFGITRSGKPNSLGRDYV